MTIAPVTTKILNSIGTSAFGVNSGKSTSATSPISKTNEDTLTAFSPDEKGEEETLQNE